MKNFIAPKCLQLLIKFLKYCYEINIKKQIKTIPINSWMKLFWITYAATKNVMANYVKPNKNSITNSHGKNQFIFILRDKLFWNRIRFILGQTSSFAIMSKRRLFYTELIKISIKDVYLVVDILTCQVNKLLHDLWFIPHNILYLSVSII